MSKIEWTDETWNPTRGCRRVSPGCENCYAERQAIRQAGPGKPYEGLVKSTPSGPRWTGKIRLAKDMLTLPLHWRKPRMAFVDSMSDLFYMPFGWIDQVYAVMALAHRHTFQILTKRPKRAEEYYATEPWDRINSIAGTLKNWDGMAQQKIPPKNVWLGVSVENQETADQRIPPLLRTPAAIRFVSYEPVLAPVDFSKLWMRDAYQGDKDSGVIDYETIDWLIVGGESGPGARECKIEWIRNAVQQCRQAEVACFVKQLGARPRNWCVATQYDLHQDYEEDYCDLAEAGLAPYCGARCAILKDKKCGDPSEWPEDLQVRQMPIHEAKA